MYSTSLYYPYHSPYADIVPNVLSVSQKIADLQTLDHYTKLAQSEAILKANEQVIANQNYARSLLINSKIERDLYQKLYGNTVDEVKFNVAQSNVQYNYLKKIQELRRQREMLEHPARFNFYPEAIEQKLKNNDERFMSDDELVNYYQSGAKGQDYHYEMYRQLQNKNQAAKNDLRKVMSPSKTDRIHNKNYNPIKQKQHQIRQRSRYQREIGEEVQRSYVDELNDSSDNRLRNTSDLAFERSRKQYNRGATIDVVKNHKQDFPQANTFYCSSKKKKSDKNLNKTALMDSSKSKAKGRKKINSTFTKPCTISFNAAITESAMQKINNRLKVSGIVYKDSKLRHVRHEGEHLFNTFENQLKTRKEVKDKINNNPAVLKKHNMVVTSR